MYQSKNPDAQTYTRANSGCPTASAFLGHQSSCLDCPFDPCIYDLNRRQVKKLVQSVYYGTPPLQAASVCHNNKNVSGGQKCISVPIVRNS